MLLRNFLKQEPHPVRFKGYEPGAEDAPRNVRVNDAKSRWRDAELSLKGCVRIEALDPDGAILRTWEDPDYSAPEARGERAMSKNGSEDWRGNLAEMARIITESNRDAVALHSDSYRAGWEVLLSIVKLLSDRLNALERAYHKQVMSIEPPEAEATSPQMQALLALAGPALAALTSGNTPPQPPQKPQPPPKKPNGAA